MKVLLVTPKHPPTYTDSLYVALRAKVGTCDFFPLDDRQSANMEEFFRRHIKLAHFDRILLMFDPQFIYNQSPFLRRLPTLAVLSLDEYQDSNQDKRMLANFRTMPWIRWIGMNMELCHQYQELGYDAYWIPPVYDNNLFNTHANSRYGRFIHVYGNKSLQDLLGKILPPDLPISGVSNNTRDLVGQIVPQDIFIYWPNDEDQNSLMPLIHAMACGASIITRDIGLEKRVLYGWRSDHDMIFVDSIKSIPSKIKMLLQNHTFRVDLSNNAIQKAKMFQPSSVGRRIGIHTEIPVRNPSNYPMKQRIFGFEI